VRGALSSALLAALVCAAPAFAQDGRLLRRHVPELRYDSQERDRATTVSALVSRPLDERGSSDDHVSLEIRGPVPDVVYGRVTSGSDGRTWLQYWMLYRTNPQDRGILRTGRHEGDWEVVQVALGRRNFPERVTYSQHRWAESCAWREVPSEGFHPVVYVANASHATYPRPGDHDRPWPDPTDEADGRGRHVQPRVIVIEDADLPGWLQWPGLWGRTRARLIPGETFSPRGPAFQDDGPWRDPVAYEERSRECGSGAAPHPWPAQAGAIAVGGLLGLPLGLWLGHRRRRLRWALPQRTAQE
jgi:hypothetical protein